MFPSKNINTLQNNVNIYTSIVLACSCTRRLPTCTKMGIISNFASYTQPILIRPQAQHKHFFQLQQFPSYLASFSFKVDILPGRCLSLLPLPAGRKKLERQIGSCGHKSLLEKSIQTGSGSKTLHKLCRQSFIFTSVYVLSQAA